MLARILSWFKRKRKHPAPTFRSEVCPKTCSTDKPNYYAKTLESIETKPGCWRSLRVGVFDGDTQIGEYQRNYPSLYKTFYPFKKNGKWYALYSKDYTATRVMSLPDCKDICGEEPSGFGFCPVELYVPMSANESDGEDLEDELPVDFGFVAGCVWGDDSSWKIQYIDLSLLEQGIIKREDRFGYTELPRDMELREAIYIDKYSDATFIRVVGSNTYRVTGSDFQSFHNSDGTSGKTWVDGDYSEPKES